MYMPLAVPTMDPCEIFTNLSALHILEDRSGGFDASFNKYLVSDYSNGTQGSPLFAGSMDSGSFRSISTTRMALSCLSIIDSDRIPVRFLEIAKNDFDDTCTISYLQGPQPMLLGAVVEDCGCCGRTLSVIDPVAKRLLYYIRILSQCCSKYHFGIVDPANTVVGDIHIVARICGNNQSVLQFPAGADWMCKSLFLCAVIYISIHVLRRKK